MKKLLNTACGLALAGSIGGATSVALHKEAVAQSFDIDCQVILCLAGGFPTGCAAAFSYMIDRITSFPPKPPFGFCALSDGSEYDRHNVNFSFISGRQSYVCPEGKQLFYQPQTRFQGLNVFCYDSIATTGNGRFQETVFLGREDAKQFNYQIQITVEPGTSSEYVSPTYLGNLGTGEFIEL